MTCLDLIREYFHFVMRKKIQKFISNHSIGENYSYNRIPQGLKKEGDVLQEKMTTIVVDFDHVITYMDHILLVTKSSFV